MVLAIVVIAFGVRIAFASIYSVATFRDSADYLLLAQQLKDWDLSANSGWRTPVYSILILLVSFDLDAIWLLQSLMGIIISIIIFLLISGATGSRWAGAIAALAQALALNQLALEASILTETAATLFLVATVYAVDRSWRLGWSMGWILLAAFFAALATLTRPTCIALLPVVVLLALWKAPRPQPLAAAAFSGVVALPLLAWMLIQSATVGAFSISTLLGYNLTTHVNQIVERAPDKFSVIRDTFVEYRQKIAQEGGSQTMTIFSAKPAIQERTGMSTARLSNELTKMSINLIIDNPREYLKSVTNAWIHFFFYLITMLKEDNFSSPWVLNFVYSLDWFQRWTFRLMYIGFLAVSLPLVYVGLIKRKGLDPQLNTGVFLTLVVLTTSVLQALLQFGGNGRFSLPTQSLAVGALIICINSFHGHFRRVRER